MISPVPSRDICAKLLNMLAKIVNFLQNVLLPSKNLEKNIKVIYNRDMEYRELIFKMMNTVERRTDYYGSTAL